MSTQVNRQIVLAARPHGDPKASDFAIVEGALPVPGDGQVLTRNILLSLDPYNRIIMGNANSDQPSLNIGDPMFGFTIAVIEQSNNPASRSVTTSPASPAGRTTRCPTARTSGRSIRKRRRCQRISACSG
ncbi:hypothetical protein [Streptomyces sp. NPDC005970]|uniref:hypothetical protein n=1 Tax=Streptomyces sp. NPDC005970 TaxID=3156723 RepID=UPI0033E249F2